MTAQRQQYRGSLRRVRHIIGVLLMTPHVIHSPGNCVCGAVGVFCPYFSGEDMIAHRSDGACARTHGESRMGRRPACLSCLYPLWDVVEACVASSRSRDNIQ